MTTYEFIQNKINHFTLKASEEVNPFIRCAIEDLIDNLSTVANSMKLCEACVDVSNS